MTLENLQIIGDTIKESSQRNIMAQPMIESIRFEDEDGAKYTSNMA